MINIGGIPYYILEFGDELVYFTPYTLTLFLLALTFTVLVIISRPEKQVDMPLVVMHTGPRKSVSPKCGSGALWQSPAVLPPWVRW